MVQGKTISQNHRVRTCCQIALTVALLGWGSFAHMAYWSTHERCSPWIVCLGRNSDMSRELDQQILNLPAVKCSNKRPGRVTHNVGGFFPSMFLKTWPVSRLLSALRIPHICLSAIKYATYTHTLCTCISVSSEGHA